MVHKCKIREQRSFIHVLFRFFIYTRGICTQKTHTLHNYTETTPQQLLAKAASLQSFQDFQQSFFRIILIHCQRRLFVAEKDESEPNLSSFFNKTLGNFARVSFIDDVLVADSPTTHQQTMQFFFSRLFCDRLKAYFEL